MIYKILECCRRHGVKPMAYLTDVLKRLPGMTNHDLEKTPMTPAEWKKSQGTLRQALAINRRATLQTR